MMAEKNKLSKMRKNQIMLKSQNNLEFGNISISFYKN